jgi:hypothetical protein
VRIRAKESTAQTVAFVLMLSVLLGSCAGSGDPNGSAAANLEGAWSGIDSGVGVTLGIVEHADPTVLHAFAIEGTATLRVVSRLPCTEPDSAVARIAGRSTPPAESAGADPIVLNLYADSTEASRIAWFEGRMDGHGNLAGSLHVDVNLACYGLAIVQATWRRK